VILGGYGPDVVFIDRALTQIFDTYAVEPRRIAVGGFSDGASYALSLGLINGALFSDILAFSPGFAAPTRAEDTPRVFISHGVDDRVLPIDACSRRLAPALKREGYDVAYREFEGGHVVPPEMVTAAIARFLA
jgi:phospholipase/carboxylesterase